MLNTVKQIVRHRKRWLVRIGLLIVSLPLVGVIGTIAFSCATPPPPVKHRPLPPTGKVAETTVALKSGRSARVLAFNIGSIAIYPCHARLCLDEDSALPLRFLRVFLGPSERAPPLPILVYVIDHPDGVFVVDTGETPAFENDPDAYACAPANGVIDHKIGRLDIQPENTLDARLRAEGIVPSTVRGAVLTHLHFDHVGGVPALGPNVPVYTTRADTMVQSSGATPCRTLQSSKMVYVDDEVKPAAAFPLTADGALRILQTPGHTPGSLTVSLEGESIDLEFVGDTTFSSEMLANETLCGIHVDNAQVRAENERLVAKAHAKATVLLPAHDAGAPERLSQQQPFRAPVAH